MAFDLSALQRLRPAELYARFLTEGVRPDGRDVDGFRKLTVSLDPVPAATTSAASSCLVRLGGTSALAAVTLGARDMPPSMRGGREWDALLSVDVALSAVASPRFQLSAGGGSLHSAMPAAARVASVVAAGALNRPAEDPAALSHRIKTALTRSGWLHAAPLLLSPPRSDADDDAALVALGLESGDTLEDAAPAPSWASTPAASRQWGVTLAVDVVVVGYDGNAFDAAMLAATVALSRTTLPPAVVNAKGVASLVAATDAAVAEGVTVLRGAAIPLLPCDRPVQWLVPASFAYIPPVPDLDGAPQAAGSDESDAGGDAASGGGRQGWWVTDPTVHEADLATGALSIVVSVPGASSHGCGDDEVAVVAMHQQGVAEVGDAGGAITALSRLTEVAKARGRDVAAVLADVAVV